MFVRLSVRGLRHGLGSGIADRQIKWGFWGGERVGGGVALFISFLELGKLRLSSRLPHCRWGFEGFFEMVLMPGSWRPAYLRLMVVVCGWMFSSALGNLRFYAPSHTQKPEDHVEEDAKIECTSLRNLENKMCEY